MGEINEIESEASAQTREVMKRPIKSLPRKTPKSLIPKKTNFNDLPADILIIIFKLKICAENRCLGRTRIPPHLLPKAALPLAHICRSIRDVVLSYPGFWRSITWKSPEVLRRMALKLSGDLPLDIDIHTERYYPVDPDYSHLIKIFDLMVPHAHRWESFSISFCTQGRESYAEHFQAVAKLELRLKLPNLKKLQISYNSGDIVFMRELLNYGDISEGGVFYHRWETPLLTELVTIDYIPHYIKDTITKWTLKFVLFVHEVMVVNTLANVPSSLETVHFEFGERAQIRGVVKREKWAECRIDVPSVKQLQISVTEGRSECYGLTIDFFGSLLRFSNLKSLTLILHQGDGPSSYFPNCLEDFFKNSSTYPSLETLHIIMTCGPEYSAENKHWSGPHSWRHLPNLRHLKFTGNFSEIPFYERHGDEICKELKFISLISCCSDIAPWVSGLVAYMKSKGSWGSFVKLTTENSTANLEKKMRELVGDNMLDVVSTRT